MLRITLLQVKDHFFYKKNDTVKVILVCSNVNYQWRIYASRNKCDNIFGIRKCNLDHICGDDNFCSRGNPRDDSLSVANVVKDKLRTEPLYHPCTMIKDIHQEYV